MSVTEFMRAKEEEPSTPFDEPSDPHVRAQLMGPIKDYQPTEWTDRHRLVVALKTSGLFTNKQIAKLTGFSDTWVSIIWNDPRAQVAREEFVGAVADQLEDAMAILKAAAPAAARKIVAQINSDDDKISQRAGLAVLDRTGFTPFNKNLTAPTSPIGAETAARMAETVEHMRAMRELPSSYRMMPSEGEADADGRPANPAP